MGLVAMPNGNKNKVATTRDASSVIELFDVPDHVVEPKRKRQALTEDEEAYMAKCMEKWGEDYAGMFRDIKVVNTQQHTEAKLRKLGARYILLSEDQRRVEVPKNVEILLPAV
jgi:hypothetical protein